MTLADSNIWLALALSKHEFHEAARTWLRAPELWDETPLA